MQKNPQPLQKANFGSYFDQACENGKDTLTVKELKDCFDRFKVEIDSNQIEESLRELNQGQPPDLQGQITKEQFL
jgi:Ca2+-binding EF-hand superfamily protein